MCTAAWTFWAYVHVHGLVGRSDGRVARWFTTHGLGRTKFGWARGSGVRDAQIGGDAHTDCAWAKLY